MSKNMDIRRQAKNNKNLVKSQYNLKVISDLIKQVNEPGFEKYFAGQNPQDVMNDLVIVVEDNKMTIEWLESRYSNLVRSSLNTVVRITIDLLEIVNEKKYHEPIVESKLIDFLKVNEEKIAYHNMFFMERKLREDYKEGLVNLQSCSCGCNEVSNKLISLRFPDQESILGITIEGAVCSVCKKEYFLNNNVKILDIFEGVLQRNDFNNK